MIGWMDDCVFDIADEARQYKSEMMMMMMMRTRVAETELVF